ncbi:Zn(2)-C6 fungal-type domain-containing protein [Fusarium falciforme]|uniref:Zn(2)-C6 fungal-type domain-containing protein n=1 Tax=Fusarium falciforme TaxID=195108 RepID=UPI002301F989|nr:Zn(2)-C6 fungal-type domain-containing protein [Fusarium falciforme]WAO93321.1 Zn(2)-C6 fungal-type domain-containing protein [Fusarium falciforme]
MHARSAKKPRGSYSYGGCQRSQVSMSTELRSTFSNKTIDESLSTLEAKSRDTGTPNDEAVTIGPFGVFSVESNTTTSTPVSDITTKYNSEAQAKQPNTPENAVSLSHQPLLAVDSMLNTDNLLDWTDLFDLDSSPSWFPAESTIDIDALNELPHTAALPSFNSDASWEGVHLSNLGINSLAPLKPKTPRIAFSELVTVEDAQMLLKHYSDCMITHIWSLPLGQKSSMDIHIDAAVTTLARLTFIAIRPVSHASLSHLYAVLALSSMHLANGKKEKDAEYWQKFAERLNKEAQETLRYSLQHEVSPKAAKYKDMLLSISSILSFAILFDRQKDVKSYLLGSEKLVRTCGLAKKKISRKISYLHHTYTWCKIVGESTYVLPNPGNADPALDISTKDQAPWKETPGIFSQIPYTDNRQYCYNTRLDDFLGLEPFQQEMDAETIYSREGESPLDYIPSEGSPGKSDSTLRFLYGVSETWLSLVSQTTRLANYMERISQSREKPDTASLESLESHKKHLENLVWTFTHSNPSQVEDLNDASESTPRAHLVRALNYALIIFFYRRIKEVNPGILQQHVDNIVRALQEFDAACERDGIDGPGSPWPAYLAGCEAMGSSQREYLSGWLQKSFDKTGFTRFRTIISCMHEVWRRQEEALETGRQDWTWVHVSKEQNLYVMLC